MLSFGIIFLVTSLMLLLFKGEKKKNSFSLKNLCTNEQNCLKIVQKNVTPEEMRERLSIFSTYKMIWNITKVKAIRKLSFIYLTDKVITLI